MAIKPITASVVSAQPFHGEKRPAIARIREGEEISFAEMEAQYKQPGRTILSSVWGSDPFDIWIGRFYLGFFGVISLIGIVFGTTFYLYQAWVVEHAFNIFQARIDPPPISAGLRLLSPSEPGFFWQLIVFFATIAFLGWLMRQVDLSRKLGISYEIPIAYGAVVSSWLTLQWFRPIAMGAWGNGFALGITHHLDWVSNTGYEYYNFFYNPFHAAGISLLFFSTLILAMHGSAILSTVNRPDVSEDNVDGFWRNIIGYSIGEVGIHRAAFWVGVSAVLVSNLCIFLSGTLVDDWAEFWRFWDHMPIWESAAVATVLAGAVLWHGQRSAKVSTEELEYGGVGIDGAWKVQGNFMPFRRLFDIGQMGPIHIGLAGTIALAAGALSAFIILESYLYQVGYNPILFVREFFVLSVAPPAMAYGLDWAPWHAGGAWMVATFLLSIAILAWWWRVYSRARKAGLSTHLAWGFAAAIFFYFIAYFIRPILIGNWSQAPAHGAKAILDWTNNVSVQFGNFYYNPFHMLSIFFLLGSTLLLAMHGATIVATSSYGSHREIEEMMTEGTGTQRAQLFWRWCMGWNVNSKTIHEWCWWFAAMTAITGGIGLLLSGTLIMDWFAWAQSIGIVAPLP